MACLGAVSVDPAVAVSKSTAAALAMTAFDASAARIAFNAPASGKVLVRIRCVVHGAIIYPQILLGVLSGASVVMRQAPRCSLSGTALATTFMVCEAIGVITGLTPGAAITYDAAYGVETLAAATAIKYGGPNNATANDAFGGLIFEVWDA